MCLGVLNYTTSFCLQGKGEKVVSLLLLSACDLPSDASCLLVWTSRASEFPRDYDGACLQMRLSYSPAAHIFLFLVQWTDCSLAGALGLLRILIYKVCGMLCPCRVVGSVLTLWICPAELVAHFAGLC